MFRRVDIGHFKQRQEGRTRESLAPEANLRVCSLARMKTVPSRMELRCRITGFLLFLVKNV